jgi:hypothetical protein
MTGISGEYEGHVIDSDDGENDTLDEARTNVATSLQETIDELILLKREVEKEPMKKLKKNYLE